MGFFKCDFMVKRRKISSLFLFMLLHDLDKYVNIIIERIYKEGT